MEDHMWALASRERFAFGANRLRLLDRMDFERIAETLLDRFHPWGLERVRLRTLRAGFGCNQYVFRRCVETG